MGVRGAARLKRDVEMRVIADFALEERNEALSILQQLDDELGDGQCRVLRCVLFLASGELARLAHYAERAQADWRDVIYWAEYDDQDRRIRDFSLPFPDLE